MTGDQAPTRETRSFSVHIVQTSSTLEICPKLFCALRADRGVRRPSGCPVPTSPGRDAAVHAGLERSQAFAPCPVEDSRLEPGVASGVDPDLLGMNLVSEGDQHVVRRGRNTLTRDDQ